MARVNSLMVSYWQYSESLPTRIAVNNNLELRRVVLPNLVFISIVLIMIETVKNTEM